MTRYLLILTLCLSGCLAPPAKKDTKPKPSPAPSSAVSDAAEAFPGEYATKMAEACDRLANKAANGGWTSFDAMYAEMGTDLDAAQVDAMKPLTDASGTAIKNSEGKLDNTVAAKMFRDMASGLRKGAWK